MLINTVIVNKAKLTEGKYYWFKILKMLELENDDKQYVMEDPFGYKILIPAKQYKNYNFKLEEKVLCRVDKINCKGRIFIEPSHPHYKENKSYYFKYIESKEKNNFFDQKEYIVVVVADVYNNHWEVKTKKENLNIDKHEVKCYVEKIKKGRLFLHLVNDNNTKPPVLMPGENYDFLIVDEKTNPENNKRYFILEDKYQNKHLLQKKHYLKYNLKVGQKLTCRIDKLSTEGYYYLEPVHPFYKISKKYVFPLKRIDKLVYANNVYNYFLVVEDIYGDEIFVDMGNNIDNLNINKEEIECIVKDIYKGNPVLDVVLK